MKVTIIGCGEAFEERFPNNSTLIEGASTLLCDCGYSVPPAVWRAGFVKDAIDILYISHAHADHYFGLPALLGRMWEDGRTRPLTILSQAPVLAQVRDLLDYGYRTLASRFAYAIDWRVAAETPELGGFRFAYAPTSHSVTNFAVRVEAGSRAVVYSGDGMFTAESAALVRAADLVIHEAFSFEESPVHADITRLIAMAGEQKVQRLALVHIQRRVRAMEAKRIHDAISAAPLTVSMPEPGATWTL